MTAKTVAPMSAGRRRRPLRRLVSDEEDDATLAVVGILDKLSSKQPPLQSSPSRTAVPSCSPRQTTPPTTCTTTTGSTIKKSVHFASHAQVFYLDSPASTSSSSHEDDEDVLFFSPRQEARRLHQHYERLRLAQEWRHAGYAALLHQDVITHPSPRHQASLNAHVLLADQLHNVSFDDSVRGMEDYLQVTTGGSSSSSASSSGNSIQWAYLKDAIRSAHWKVVLSTYASRNPEQTARVSRQSSAASRYWAHQLGVADHRAAYATNTELLHALQVLCQHNRGILDQQGATKMQKQMGSTKKRNTSSLFSWLFGSDAQDEPEEDDRKPSIPLQASGDPNANGMEWLFFGALAPLVVVATA